MHQIICRRQPAALSPVTADALTCLIVAAGILAVFAVQGLPTLFDARGDNDSLMRMVEVRDLIAGQGWFDLTQYRMGLPGGFIMHWSRLVDAPIALAVIGMEAVGAEPQTAAEIAATLWPALLSCAALFLTVRIVRALSDDWARLPAIVVGAAALYATGLFVPGNVDHHNVQLVLVLSMALGLVRSGPNYRGGLFAGASAGLMLAVGMETLPYVAAGGLVAGLRFGFGQREEARPAAGFGLGLAGVSLAVMLATVHPSQWGVAHCDAFSIAQFTAAVVAGGGLALAATWRVTAASRRRRLVAIGALALVLAAMVVGLFPQCVGDPYSGLDPQLRAMWLDNVAEAQPFWRVLASDPALALGSFATPLLALGVLAYGLRRPSKRRGWLAVGALLVAAVAVSLWQLRGAMFSIPLAAIVLADWLGRMRAKNEAGGNKRQAAMLVAWLASVSLFWSSAAAGGAIALSAIRAHEPGEGAAASPASGCYAMQDYDGLAALPAGLVLAPSNLGPAILRYSKNSVFAGPYHRNVDGLKLAFAAFTGDAGAARGAVAKYGVRYVAICRGNDEAGLLAKWAPRGLMADLLAGRTPKWLVPVSAPDAALSIYRVAFPAGSRAS